MRAPYMGTDPLFISELSRLEFVSATTRKRNEGTLNDDERAVLLARFLEDIEQRFELLHFSTMVIEEAIQILGRQQAMPMLRTLDALQYSFYKNCCGSGTVFVCADLRLTSAVSEAGYAVLNPEQF